MLWSSSLLEMGVRPLRRLFRLSLVLLLLVSMSSGVRAVGGLSVQVNGTQLTLDEPPFIEGGRMLVPLRPIFEALDAAVTWDGTRNMVTATRANRSIQLTVDSTEAVMNGEKVKLSTPMRLKSGRTFVPLRFVAESLGASVDFDDRSNTAIVVDLHYLGELPERELLQQLAIIPGRRPQFIEYEVVVRGYASPTFPSIIA